MMPLPVRVTVFAGLACITAGLVACGSSGAATTESAPDAAGPAEAAAPAESGTPDAGVDATPIPIPKTITVTTLAPAVPGSRGGKASATWAAWQSDEGAWVALVPTSDGTYSFTVTGARWAIALVCAESSRASAVDVHRRPTATTSLEVTLEPECLATSTAVHSLTGNLTNVPATTSWIELGYPLESRGSVVGVAGTTAAYELINAHDGTWDFAFGVRNEYFSPLTRVMLQRGKTLNADAVFDLDFATAIVPIPKPLAVHGLATNEVVGVAIYYATGAFAGLAVGPQNVPTTTPDVATSYDALPATSQLAGDRYRATFVAEKDKRSDIVRTIEASFHAAIDLDLTLPPVVGAPVATAKKTATSVTVSAHAPVHAGAASYALVATVMLNDRDRRAFRTTFPPSMVAETLEVTPDLSAVAGFDPSWLLPQDSSVDVTAVAIEAPVALGDGTRTRTSTHKITTAPAP